MDWNLQLVGTRTRQRGRTLHECVDWNKNGVPSKGEQKVALYTSAWIEIFVIHGMFNPKLRRTLHECVDWNCVGKRDVIQFPVALYTSAWIEIVSNAIGLDSRYCRTLHECVDWNNAFLSPTQRLFSSHSTRVRGLKWRRLRNRKKSWQSHSTRVRGLKYNGRWWRCRLTNVALYTSAWIEITNARNYLIGRFRRTLHECVDWN